MACSFTNCAVKRENFIHLYHAVNFLVHVYVVTADAYSKYPLVIIQNVVKILPTKYCNRPEAVQLFLSGELEDLWKQYLAVDLEILHCPTTSNASQCHVQTLHKPCEIQKVTARVC